MFTKIYAILILIMSIFVPFKCKGKEAVYTMLILDIIGWLMLIYAALNDIKELWNSL